MDLLDDTITAATDLGRVAANQATGAAAVAGKGIVDAAHHSQTALEDLGDAATGTDRSTSRRLVLAAFLAAVTVCIVIWRRRSGRQDPKDSTTPRGNGMS